MIVLDTSFLYGLLDRRDRRHGEAAAWYRSVDDELATTPLILAEVDYLATRAGTTLRDAFRRDIDSGAYMIGWWDTAVASLGRVASRYADLGISLADASLVWLANKTDITDIITVDRSDFAIYRTAKRKSFRNVFPA